MFRYSTAAGTLVCITNFKGFEHLVPKDIVIDSEPDVKIWSSLLILFKRKSI